MLLVNIKLLTNKRSQLSEQWQYTVQSQAYVAAVIAAAACLFSSGLLPQPRAAVLRVMFNLPTHCGNARSYITDKTG